MVQLSLQFLGRYFRPVLGLFVCVVVRGFAFMLVGLSLVLWVNFRVVFHIFSCISSFFVLVYTLGNYVPLIRIYYIVQVSVLNSSIGCVLTFCSCNISCFFGGRECWLGSYCSLGLGLEGEESCRFPVC